MAGHSTAAARPAHRGGTRALAYQASLARAGALLAVGDLDGVDRLAERERRLTQERPVPHHRWLTLILQATHAMVDGNFAEGERLAEDALGLGRAPLGEAATLAYGAQLVFLRWLQGRPAEVEAVLERLIAQQPSAAHGWRRLLPLAYAGRGRAPSGGRPHLSGRSRPPPRDPGRDDGSLG